MTYRGNRNVHRQPNRKPIAQSSETNNIIVYLFRNNNLIIDITTGDLQLANLITTILVTQGYPHHSNNSTITLTGNHDQTLLDRITDHIHDYYRSNGEQYIITYAN